MGRKYYLDPVTKEKIYIRNTVSKPPVIDVQVNGESVLILIYQISKIL